MPLYDTICPVCNVIEEDLFLKMNERVPVCPTCGKERHKICNCKHFKLVYNNKTDICAWGNENYNSTQRYRYVKNDVN